MATAATMFKVRRTFTFSDKAHGRSKTQMCLKKIIDFISSSQEMNQISDEELKARDLVTKKRGISIDLNLRLGLLSESENLIVNNKGFSACSGVGDGDGVGDGKVCGVSNIDCNSSVDKSSEGECDPIKEVVEGFPEIEVNREEEEERREISEITNLPEMETEREDGEQSQIKAGEEEEEDEEAEVVERENERVVVEEVEEEEEGILKRRNCKKEGYLDLLVEAARLISGNFEDDDETDEEEVKRRQTLKIIETETNKTIVGGRSKRNQSSWMLDFYEGFEDISPVVRSKRGRNQVLPYRYRDSVLDPWKRFSKQRSSRVSNKNKRLV